MPAADEQPVRQFFVAVGRHDGRRGPLRYICPSTPAQPLPGGRTANGFSGSTVGTTELDSFHRYAAAEAASTTTAANGRVDRQQIPCPTLCTNVAWLARAKKRGSIQEAMTRPHNGRSERTRN